MLCNCNSGLEKYPLHDARGIFVSYVCENCEKDIKEKYRKDIFENPHYQTDEPIEDY